MNLQDSQLNENVATINAGVMKSGTPESYGINATTLLGDVILSGANQLTKDDLSLTDVDINFPSGCLFQLNSVIGFSDLPVSTSDSPIVSGNVRKKLAGFGSNRRFLPELNELLLSREPQEIRIIYRNDEYPDGLTWNKAMGPIGFNVAFRVAVELGDGQGTHYTDWV